MQKLFQGRWNHAYKLWNKALSQDSFPQFDKFLSNEFAKNSQYGAKDRRWYSEILFAAVRHCYFALFCSQLKNDELTIKFIENFKLKFQSSFDIFNELKKLNSQDFFSWISLRYDDSQNLFQNFTTISQEKINLFSHFKNELEKENSLEYKLIYHSVPLWFIPFIQARFKIDPRLCGDDKPPRDDITVIPAKAGISLRSFLNNLDTRPPLWLRLNHIDKKQEVIEEFKKEKYEIEERNSAVKVTGSKGVFVLNSYKNGLFEIQDLASQHIGEHIRAQPKQYVWDCCAGGGGKTLQIASLLNNKGVIYASDIREYKLEEVKKRAKRAGFFNIRCLPWEGKSLPQFQKEIQNKGGFDWVLVDAPCSSSGIWRRNPDAKYKVNKQNLETLCELQLSILIHASKAVINGGHLVYSTCSWIIDENEGVVEQFLLQNKQFELVEQNLLGSPTENSDTMFAAVLRKK